VGLGDADNGAGRDGRIDCIVSDSLDGSKGGQRRGGCRHATGADGHGSSDRIKTSLISLPALNYPRNVASSLAIS